MLQETMTLISDKVTAQLCSAIRKEFSLVPVPEKHRLTLYLQVFNNTLSASERVQIQIHETDFYDHPISAMRVALRGIVTMVHSPEAVKARYGITFVADAWYASQLRKLEAVVNQVKENILRGVN